MGCVFVSHGLGGASYEENVTIKLNYGELSFFFSDLMY